MNMFFSKRAGKAVVGIAVLAIVLGLLLTGAKFFGKITTPDPSGVDPFSEELVYINGGWYCLRDSVETLLLVGLDKYEHQGLSEGYLNDRQSDVVVLLIIDRDEKICRVLPINRDTMVQNTVLGLGGETVMMRTEQLALAHTYGSGKQDSARNVCRSVSSLLFGVPIDHYVTMTMDGINLLNEAVGGVEVFVEDDFSAITDKLPMGQTVKLQGNLAEIFVRSRGGMEDPRNTNRMERQRRFMEGLISGLQQKARADEAFAMDTITKMADTIFTDCSVQKLEKIYDTLSGYEIQMLSSPAGELKMGKTYWEFYADDEELKTRVTELFYEPHAAPEDEDE